MLPPRNMFKRVVKSEALLRLGAWALAAYLGVCARTTRWQLEGEAHLAEAAQGGPLVLACWHECLPLMPALWLRARRMNPARRATVLVSRHRDGRFIGAILQRFGLEVAHGSSARAGRADKGGASALRSLLQLLAQGQAVALTPDGPRGPARQAAGGLAALAALSGAPVLITAAHMRPMKRLRSWDRMMLPVPFGRGALVCLAPVLVAREAAEASLPGLQAALDAAAARAEALCA